MLRNIIGLIVGYLAGSAVNFGLIMVNMALLPAGTDFSTPEGVNAAMAHLGPINYAVVFFVVALIAAVFGFSGSAAGAAGIAKILFVLFLIGAVITFFLSLGRRA